MYFSRICGALSKRVCVGSELVIQVVEPEVFLAHVVHVVLAIQSVEPKVFHAPMVCFELASWIHGAMASFSQWRGKPIGGRQPILFWRKLWVACGLRLPQLGVDHAVASRLALLL